MIEVQSTEIEVYEDTHRIFTLKLIDEGCASIENVDVILNCSSVDDFCKALKKAVRMMTV